MSISAYHPFIGSFCSIVGIGLFGAIIWIQHGGLVSPTQPQHDSSSIVNVSSDVPNKIDDESKFIELPEVIVTGDKVVHRTTNHKKIYQCRQHILHQGGTIENPTVDMCRWITLP